MGEVVPLHPQTVPARWRDEVTFVCDLAGFPERAAIYLARGTRRSRVYFDLMALRPDLRSPTTNAIFMRQLCGPAGTARRSRPIHPAPHGTRRRPTKDITA